MLVRRFSNLFRSIFITFVVPLLCACNIAQTQQAEEASRSTTEISSVPWRIDAHAPASVAQSVRDLVKHVSIDADTSDAALEQSGRDVRRWVTESHPWTAGYSLNVLTLATGITLAADEQRHADLITLMADLRDLGFLRTALSTLDALCRSLSQNASRTPSASQVYGHCERNLGVTWLALVQPHSAKAHLQLALKLRATSTISMRAQSLADLGSLERQLGNYTQAGDFMQEAYALLRGANPNDAERLAQSALALAGANMALGKYDRAEKLAAESLDIAQSHDLLLHPVAVGGAATLAGLEYAHARFFDAQRGLEAVYEQRQRLFVSDHPGIGTSLLGLGNVKRKLGNVTEALAYYEQALEIYTTVYSQRSQPVAAVRSVMGVAHAQLGEIDASIEQHRLALDIRRAVHPAAHAEIASSLGNLALMYGRLGRADEQETLIRDALSIAKQVFDEDNPALSRYFNLMGYANRQQQRYGQAITAYEAALEIREKTFGKNHEAVARILTNIGDAWLLSGNREKAVEFNQRALQICERASCIEAGLYTRVLNNFAEALPHDRVEAALETLVKARAMATALEIKPEINAILEANIARHYWTQERHGLAIALMKRSVQRIHSLAQSTRFSSERQAAQFTKNHGALYRRLAQWLMARDRHQEAEQIFDLLNAYEYGRYTRSKPSGSLFVSAEEREALAEVDRLSGALHRIQRELSDLVSSSSGSGDSAEIRKRERRIEELIEKLPSLNDVLLADEQSLSARERSAIEELSNTSLENAVYQLQQLKTKGKRGAVLRYVVLPERVAIFVASAGTWSVHSTVRISEDELARQIFDFRRTVRESRDAKAPSESLKQQSAQLFSLLVSPVLETLATVDPEMLFLDLDQSMRYLPFGALHDGERFLGERYSLVAPVFMNRIQGDVSPRREDAATSHAFGVSKEIKTSRLGALPWVARELDLIVKENSEDVSGVVPGRVFLDEQFVRSSLEQSVKSGTSHLHVASHFVFAPGDDSRSYLLLGDGSRLSVRDMTRPRRLRKLKDVSLLSLSACDTALGSADLAALSGDNATSHGSEIDGAATSAINAGARSVLATLWKVQDASTAVFMTRFYSHLSEGSSKVDALRLTQSEFANATERCDSGWNRVRDFVISDNADQLCVDRSWRNPFHWAGFVLLGSWN